MTSVAWLAVAPVKGLALETVDEIDLDLTGARGDRLFHLIAEDGRLVNRKRVPALAGIRAAYDAPSGTLQLTSRDGDTISAPVAGGAPVTTSFYGRPVTGALVDGPLAGALSAWAGQPLRLVRVAPGAAHDRGADGAVSLLSTGSLAALARAAGVGDIDPRRFRMLVGVEGGPAHVEDAWLQREVEIGAAVVEPLGRCGRCAVTTQDPDTGEVTLDTLRVIDGYRGDVQSDEPIPFGVWGRVVRPGKVRVGDPVRAS